ncbi:Uncharacterized protein dnm_071450 [Desulfonema magnum]|uniref:Uncharacterized protein n=1 Tax=Desulfonema magnum TaxID=45655 RepID=A0A975GRM5_9BACT|nr:Uncharacterized protein dnm_071450 [Desulfonema magnum]
MNIPLYILCDIHNKPYKFLLNGLKKYKRKKECQTYSLATHILTRKSR